MSKDDRLLALAHHLSVTYRDTLERRAVMPTEAAIRALRGLHAPLESEGCDGEEVLNLLDRIGSPATVATTGGRFFGFVVGGALPIAIAASWLASTWDQNAGNWILSPIAAELEDVAATWLLELFDLPRQAVVGFVTGSTMGSFCAITAARSALLRRAGWNVKAKGLNGAPRLRIIASEELHPTNVAALGYAGFGVDDIEFCPTDSQGRVIAQRMPQLDEKTILLLQAGNINSGASDPFEEIIPRARTARAWTHVDGAFGLWARASSKKRHLVSGLELADSWSVDGHKWLNLPQDSAVYVSRDPEAVRDVFGVAATYLVSDARRQPNTFTPELSRRARGVEFWAALKFLGSSGVESLVDRCCTFAQKFAEGLRKAGYDVLNDVELNQVVFSCESELETRRCLERIQESGITWLGPTHWKDRFAMRISVSSWATSEEDVRRSLAAMTEALRQS